METTLRKYPTEAVLPPPDPPGPVKWVRDNLFGSFLNTSLTVISVAITYLILSSSIRWAFTQADWRPVTQFPLLYAVGQYPREALWRVGVGTSLILFLIGVSWGRWGQALRSLSAGLAVAFALFALLPAPPQITPGMRVYFVFNAALIGAGYWLGKQRWLPASVIGIGWAIAPVIALVFLSGFEQVAWLANISTTLWGGLLVTFILSAGGILLSFPIGVLLALGRRSSLPVVQVFSTVFIETIRGVPLITILFMFSFILALFLPSEARLDRLVRALIAMTIFSAAYMAENVRGGLQAIPRGQLEAARALGMSNFQTMVLIVLPQALRAVIPAIAGQFISLFKDTTLVVIVGINDLLGIGKSIINSSPEFVQHDLEVYLFISAVFWIFSYLMSNASRRLEVRLGVGTR